MSRLRLIANGFATLLVACGVPAQNEPARKQTPRPSVWVVGSVVHRRIDHTTDPERVLILAKPKPEADLRRTLLLRAGSGYPILPVGARSRPASSGSAPALRPGDVLVVPSMPARGMVAGDRGMPVAALRSTLRRLPAGAVDTELAVRLFLLRHDPDPAMARRHLDRIRALGSRAILSVRVLDDLAQHGPPALQPMLREETRRLGRLPQFCVADCFPAGTGVQVAGAMRSIESLEPGDRVLDRSGRPCRVLQVHRSRAVELLELQVRDAAGRTASLRTTPGHRFLTRAGGLVAASRLRAGELLAGGAGTEVRLVEVRSVRPSRPVWVYTLALAADLEFQVGACRLLVAAKQRSSEPAARR